MTKEISIGGVAIGQGHPVAIQSMTNTDTAHVEQTVDQILRLEQAGCEIVRVAAYDEKAARAIRAIKDRIHIPLVADVHFDYKIALAAMEAGADKVRINPGNIGSEEKIKAVVDCAKAHHIPLRVGANSGSVNKNYTDLAKARALVESALENVRVLEKYGFYDIVISLKASSVKETVLANREMARRVDYPLHLGVTEAGLRQDALIKSAMGIGGLLVDGIGDTVRVTMTCDPVEEIAAAKDILRFAGVRLFGPEIISCPTCGRTRINVESLAAQVAERVKDIKVPLKIAVMGCAVNGPGEAKDAHVGVAGGDGEGLLFVGGQAYKKVPEAQLLDELMILVEQTAREF